MIYVASMSMHPDRDSQWCDAFSRQGNAVIPFPTEYQIEDKHCLIGKIEKRFHVGAWVRGMRRRLIDIVEREKPDWVHFRLPLEFDTKTIVAIKDRGAYVSEYFNDDPFSPRRVFGLHRLFLDSISSYDSHFVYRKRNIDDFLSAGAKRVLHCPPAYVPWRHRIPDDDRSYAAPDPFDAVFIGHWENDWRTDCIDALISAGYKVCVKGGMWDRAITGRPSSILGPITPVFGTEYNELYRNARAGLCFFSKINRDSWTERALEIIAVGGLLVCERTDEALSYFADREEAFFFSSIEELLFIMKLVTSDSEVNGRVRKAGYGRLMSGMHSISDRADMVYAIVDGLVKTHATDAAETGARAPDGQTETIPLMTR